MDLPARGQSQSRTTRGIPVVSLFVPGEYGDESISSEFSFLLRRLRGVRCGRWLRIG